MDKILMHLLKKSDFNDTHPLIKSVVDNYAASKPKGFYDYSISENKNNPETLDNLNNRLSARIKYKNEENVRDALVGTLGGGALGGLAGLGHFVGSGSKKSPLIGAGLGMLGGGILSHLNTKRKFKDIENISEKDRKKLIQDYLNSPESDNESFLDASLSGAGIGAGAIGAIAAKQSGKLAGKVLVNSVKGLKQLEDKHLHEMIDAAGLKGKLRTLPTDDSHFNARFKPYLAHLNPKDKKYLNKGYIGDIQAMHRDAYVPGIMAHEIGHGNIHNSKGLTGKLQRNFYAPTGLAHRMGLGAIPAAAAYGLVGNDDDSIISGGLKGGLVGAAANAGVLIPEFEASRRGLKYMLNSSMNKKDAYRNALTTVPAFLTYLSALAGPSAVAGMLRAYKNKKKKKRDENK